MYQIKKIEAICRRQKDNISLSQAALRVGGVPQLIREHAREILTSDKADYYGDSEGMRDLRWALIETFRLRYGIDVTLPQVMVSHGCMGAFATMCIGVLGQGAEVVLPEPTYPAYRNAVCAAKAIPVFVPAYSSSNGAPWRLDLDRIRASVTDKTKMLVLSNPSNPLGAILSKFELESLVSLAEKHGFYLVVDEAYEDHVFKTEFYSSTPYVLTSNNVVRLGSFSKNFAMSGWRVGYMVAQQDLIERLIPFQDTFFSCPNQIAQFAACYALKHPELAKQSAEKVREGYAVAVQAMQPLLERQIISDLVPPATSFFLFFKIPDCKDTMGLVYDMLHAARVAVVPGIDFGPSFGQYVRLCCARTTDHVHEGVGRLTRYFQSMKKKKVFSGRQAKL